MNGAVHRSEMQSCMTPGKMMFPPTRVPSGEASKT
jgi:hypothetical protein